MNKFLINGAKLALVLMILGGGSYGAGEEEQREVTVNKIRYTITKSKNNIEVCSKNLDDRNFNIIYNIKNKEINFLNGYYISFKMNQKKPAKSTIGYHTGLYRPWNHSSFRKAKFIDCIRKEVLGDADAVEIHLFNDAVTNVPRGNMPKNLEDVVQKILELCERDMKDPDCQ